MTIRADVLIIGAGIAGLSLAWALPSHVRTVIVEREATTAFHTSGRSARQMQPSYGPAPIRALTEASIPLVAGIAKISGQRILVPRSLILFGQPGYEEDVAALLAATPTLRPISQEEIATVCPALMTHKVSSAAIDVNSYEVDVSALVNHFAAESIKHGAALRLSSPVFRARRIGDTWRVHAGAETYDVRTVVNASGAWADPIGKLFGSGELGLIPHRRTVAIARPHGRRVDPHWAMASSVSQDLYFRPDGANVLMSPSEEVPSKPCDARPHHVDITALRERINMITDLDIRKITRSWTGLRTFASDHLPVVGFDTDLPNFYWLAGQGGYGIQTASALAKLVASEITGETSGLSAQASSVLPQLNPKRHSLLRPACGQRGAP